MKKNSTTTDKQAASVGEKLKLSLQKLKSRKKDLAVEDPFNNPERAYDNASPDTDASEQFGHSNVQALSSQLDRKIIQTKKALSRIKLGKFGICEKCLRSIDTDRLMVYPEATLCIACEKKQENT